jgi:hypothetical protein
MLFEMVNENILLSNSMLLQSVILVTKDVSNISQSDLQYAVTKIVTTVQCKVASLYNKAVQSYSIMQYYKPKNNPGCG